jgi:hypothetical protein
MKHVQKPWFAVALALGSLGTGCTEARMAVPAELQQRQVLEWPVTRSMPLFRRGTLSFGPYTVREFKRGWASSSSLSVGPGAVYEGSEPYHFQLHLGDTAPLAVACRSALKGYDVNLGLFLKGLSAGESKRQLLCDIGPEGKLALAELPRLEQPFGKVVGRLKVGAVDLDIESSRMTQQGAEVTFAGFVVRHEQRTVAAIQTMNGGHVWMASDLAPEVRAAVAMVAAPVLLHGHWDTSDGVDGVDGAP